MANAKWTFDIPNRLVRTRLRGQELLHEPLLTKGTAFTREERRVFGLDGLLPATVSTLETQLKRIAENFDLRQGDLDRHVFLRAIQDRNETLFYAFVKSRLEQLVPIVYTPTVAEAVRQFSHIFERPRGIYVSPDTIDEFPEMLRSHPARDDIRLVVATDSEGILGIGDQGAGGMGIAIGKLTLYVLGAGLHPSMCLPIELDVGTDNRELLDDPTYVGWRHERLRGDRYFDFIGRFVAGLVDVVPRVLLQWEDFSKQNAFTLQDRYRSTILSFNDDVQGTGSTILAGLLGAMQALGRDLRDQRIVIYGAGAAGIGTARRLHAGLRRAGLSSSEATERLCALDSHGLILKGRAGLEPYKEIMACDPQEIAGWGAVDSGRIGLLDVVRNVKPTVLIGVSGQAGHFTEETVRTMADNADRPIVFPLSNPTSNAEATVEDLLEWTDGRALVATGSPVDPVTYRGTDYRVGQGNNVFVFPGIGLGAIVARAGHVTEDMLTQAGVALAETVSAADLKCGCLFPSISRLREVTIHVATRVARAAINEHVAPPITGDIEEAVRAAVWDPEYLTYHPL